MKKLTIIFGLLLSVNVFAGNLGPNAGDAYCPALVTLDQDAQANQENAQKRATKVVSTSTNKKKAGKK